MRLYKIIIFIAKHYFFCNRGNLSKIINMMQKLAITLNWKGYKLIIEQDNI